MYDVLHWIVSISALLIAFTTFYLQYIKKGKLVCRMKRDINPAVNVNLEKEECKFGIKLIFENNQRKDWIITFLSLDYRLCDPGSFGPTLDPWQLKLDGAGIRVPAGQTIAKYFEITLPLKNLEYWIVPNSPYKKIVRTKSDWHYPFTQIIPYWLPFYKNSDSYAKLLKYISEKCPEEHKKKCLAVVPYMKIYE